MNVVFDLGGVLVRWDPHAIAASLFADVGTRAIVLEQVFRQPDWLDLDRGSLDPEAAIDRWTERTGLARETMSRLMRRVPSSLVPVEATVALLPRLRAAGRRLYCLSNMHHASIDHLEATCAFFEHFEGAAISARIGLIKPEPGIYRHLLDTFDLAPEETVFIDDMEVNCAAAAALGIRTIRFESPAQCEADLAELGCLGE